MQFPDPLVPATLIKRYKRFLADVEMADGSVVTVHCANPGSMTGLKEVGAKVWLSPARNPARKLRWSWELIAIGEGLVGINTAHPNSIVAAAIDAGRIEALRGYETLRREVSYGKNSRVDILLEQEGRPPCYVEVKNVHLRRDRDAEFPDSVTARGAKHMEELGDQVEAGARAVIFYLVQREDCPAFSIAADIDPNYNTAFLRALDRGVEPLCYCCRLSTEAIELDHPLPLRNISPTIPATGRKETRVARP